MNSLPEAPMEQNHEPLYNIGVVARLTGIGMATLRAWERRYAFPESARTGGGHRLYTDNDVIRLRWVKERIAEGMQTSQAIHALRLKEQRSQESAQPARVETIPLAKAGLATLESLLPRLVAALLESRPELADQVMGEALASSSPEDLILRLIAPALAEIGEAWSKGNAGIAEEHFATNYLRQRLLMWMLNSPPAQVRPPVVLACAPEEWHEGSLLILGALLRRKRVPVAYLGQAVPLEDLSAFLRELRPGLVVLIAMTEGSAARLAAWPQYLPEAAASGKPVVGFGGRVYALQPEWRTRTPGVYLGDTLEEGLAKIEDLLP